MIGADLILDRGLVLTQDPLCPRAQAVAISGGRIRAVGSTEEIGNLAGPTTRRIDLGGRTLIPGFNDAHVHIWKMGHLLTSMLDLRGCDSIAALQRALRDFDQRRPGADWLLGRGYNEAELGATPTRADLDAVLPHRPLLLTRACGHIAVANSRALALARLTADTPDPHGGRILRDPHGEPSGVLEETAMGLVSEQVPESTAAQYEAMILAAAKHQIALGITSATEAGVPPSLINVYRDLDERGALPYRVNVMALRRPIGGTDTLPLPHRHQSDYLRIDTIKLLADGGLSGATAALRTSYRHCDSRGLLRLDTEELLHLVVCAHTAGLRIAVHAIGDRAIDAVLDAYQKLPPRPHAVPHRIEHFGLPDAAQIERAQRLDVVVVPQAIFIHGLGKNFREYLPPALLGRAYPLRDMLAAGLEVALSSDAPVVSDDNPLLGMQAAVTRQDAEGEVIGHDQAITAEEALRAYTVGGAQASGDADNRGVLRAGAWADMAVLSGNPLQTFTDVRVDMTFVGGALGFER